MTTGWHDPLSPIPPAESAEGRSRRVADRRRAVAALEIAARFHGAVPDEKAGEHLRNAEQILLELQDHPAVDKLPPMVLQDAIETALRRIELARRAIEAGVV